MHILLPSPFSLQTITKAPRAHNSVEYELRGIAFEFRLAHFFKGDGTPRLARELVAYLQQSDHGTLAPGRPVQLALDDDCQGLALVDRSDDEGHHRLGLVPVDIDVVVRDPLADLGTGTDLDAAPLALEATTTVGVTASGRWPCSGEREPATLEVTTHETTTVALEATTTKAAGADLRTGRSLLPATEHHDLDVVAASLADRLGRHASTHVLGEEQLANLPFHGPEAVDPEQTRTRGARRDVVLARPLEAALRAEPLGLEADVVPGALRLVLLQVGQVCLLAGESADALHRHHDGQIPAVAGVAVEVEPASVPRLDGDEETAHPAAATVPVTRRTGEAGDVEGRPLGVGWQALRTLESRPVSLRLQGRGHVELRLETVGLHD